MTDNNITPIFEDLSIRDIYGALLAVVNQYGESSLELPDRMLFQELQEIFDPKEANTSDYIEEA
jgi:hypothetical protein